MREMGMYIIVRRGHSEVLAESATVQGAKAQMRKLNVKSYEIEYDGTK